MKKIIFLLFLTSCGFANTDTKLNNLDKNFKDNLNFEEFREQLIKYSESNTYPKIDE
jgi:hypothetical protein|tara:strand:- start:311 stop:481 length:171 start_codon:yes stop_codon:yes gene_type:complete